MAGLKSLSKWSNYREYPVVQPILGVFKDMENHPLDIPPGGWRELDHCHVLDNSIQRYPGWAALIPTAQGTTPLAEANHLIFGFDFQRLNNDRNLIVASKTNIYYSDRYGATTSLKNGFTGTNSNRWTSCILNDKLYMANGVDAIQKLDPPSTIADLTGDASMPATCKYLISSAGHLVCGYTREGGPLAYYPRRVRWSDLNNDNIWISDTNNEAGYIDLPEDIGELRGIAPLGPNSFVAYGNRAIYLLSYVGLPVVWNIQRQVIREGLYMPYSLIVFNDRHYFVDSNDVKEFSGGSYTKSLGRNRISTWFFQDFNSSDLGNVFGFYHPIFPEVGWVYIPRTSTSLDWTAGKALIYNYAADCWSTRSNFPFSFVCDFQDTVQQPDAFVLLSGS